MKRAACLAIVFIAGIAYAAPKPPLTPSADEIARCLPDAFRLCSDQFPDRAAIFRCMRANKSRLSSGCRAVFNKRRL